MNGVTIETEKLVEMVAERVANKAIDKLKEVMPCSVHGEKISNIEQSLRGDNGEGLVKKVEKLKSQRWAIPAAIVVSIFVTWVLDKLV
jgi:hypothetical protein